MDSKLAIFICIGFVAIVVAMPYESSNIIRERRDVTDAIKETWNDAGKAINDAGDAVVNAVKPTEKSVFGKMADGIKSIGE